MGTKRDGGQISVIARRIRKGTKKNLQQAGFDALVRNFDENAGPETLLQRYPGRAVDANLAIAKAIHVAAPYCVVRLGNDEFETLEKWRRRANATPLRSALELLALGDPFFSLVRSRVRAGKSGLKPLSTQVLEKFYGLMTESFLEVDVLASWVRGENYYSEFFHQAHFCALADIEPYRSESPWTAALEGKKVLVVHPFDETIRRQYEENRTKLFPGTNVLPRFDLLTYRPPRSHFGEIHGASHWFELFDQMVAETSGLDFDAAIIGAGPFGLPLAAALKRQGKISIQLGGPTQLLFGIIGKRWESDELITGLRNGSWVRPSESETPSPSQRRRSPYW